MPPLRTIPNIKPVKTERTHEENQERAYIAASRRSDRSLEARIESARRASEIHKRRTGRSLRVTEQDVVNEEMYEEEDDDLPMQYRRLTAHLNTNSSDFNRRLAAYLSNHVAMRNALGEAINNSYDQQQQQPGQLLPQYTNNMQPWIPSQNPQYPSRLSQHMAGLTNNMAPAGAFRRAPYPSPGIQAQRPNFATRASESSAHESEVKTESDIDDSTEQTRRNTSSAHAEPPISVSSSTPQATEDWAYNPNAARQQHNPSNLSLSPLTMELPRETQMFFGAAYGNHDSFGEPIYDFSKQPNFAYDHNSTLKPHNGTNFDDGMNQTLAPGVLDEDSWSVSGNRGHQDGSMNDNFMNDDGSSFADAFPMNGGDFPLASPGEIEWSSFIDTASWDDSANE